LTLLSKDEGIVSREILIKWSYDMAAIFCNFYEHIFAQKIAAAGIPHFWGHITYHG
jgi:hypothetical protein